MVIVRAVMKDDYAPENLFTPVREPDSKALNPKVMGARG